MSKYDNKKFYWFKFGPEFFNQIAVKYLEKLPDSEKLIISYQKLILNSLETEGYIYLQGLFPTPEEEIAMMINQDINIVRFLMTALKKVNAIEFLDENTFFIIAIQGRIGKEGSSAERVRRFREKQKMLQCNNQNIQLLEEKNQNLKMLHCNEGVTNR